MRCGLVLAASAGLLLSNRQAFPCTVLGPDIRISQVQDIMVVWKDNVETYVFQPNFCGTSTDFGLVLPIAGPLSQQPSLIDPKVLTKAASLSEPLRKTVEIPRPETDGCGNAKIDNSSQAGGNSSSLLASGHVGILDWVELRADTTAALTDWLTANGYPYTSHSSDVFNYYVRKGWSFIAFRISQDAVPDGPKHCRTLGPIALAFPTSVPTVPSQIASAGSPEYESVYSQLTWRIFGISRGEVEVAFEGSSYSDRKLWYSGIIPDEDIPSFSGLAEAGDRLTRITLSFGVDLGMGSMPSPDGDIGLAMSVGQDYRGTEIIYAYADSGCSVGRNGRVPNSLLLLLSVLALVGLFCRRRRR